VSSPGPFSLIDQVLDGRYRVLSHLADGGMATVYIALDQRLDRQVALKVMRADLAKDESFVERFRREARSAAKLSHPNVVAVFDQGEDDGHVFLAMELVNGLTLRQVMHSEGPLTARAALDIIDPVLQALGAAHSAGLIHRDVKPENVILRDDGTVKVASSDAAASERAINWIKGIVAETGAEINIEDDGSVHIYATSPESMARAKEIIGGMSREIEVGQTYHGRVVSIKEFGAFVEVFPGKDGLVHISELADFRVNRTEDVAKMGEMIWVKCIGIDDKGRVKLSRKAALKERAEKETGQQPPADYEPSRV